MHNLPTSSQFELMHMEEQLMHLDYDIEVGAVLIGTTLVPY